MSEMPSKDQNDQSQDGTPQDGTPEQTPQDLQSGATNPAMPAVQPVQASDQTVPGGKYFVGGRYVDANGELLQ